MTPEELDILAAIRETPAEAVYRGETFQVTSPQVKRGQELKDKDIFDEPESKVTALARDFRAHWEKAGAERVKTRIEIDGETWRIADATLDAKKAGYVLTLESINK